MDDAASPVGRIHRHQYRPRRMDAVSDLGAGVPTEATLRPDRRRLTDFLDRLAVLYDVDDDIAGLRALDATIKLLPLEASVSLRGGASAPALRCSLGVVRAPPRDPDGRAGLRTAVAALRTGRAGAVADAALARAGAGAPNRAFLRGLALRVTAGHVGVRVMGWLGGNTVDERIARVEQALRALGLGSVARFHSHLAALLASNPFSAAVPYGLALALDGDGVAGAKSYFACESGDVLLDHVHGPVAQALELEGLTSPFDLLVGVMGSGWRRIRWPVEASFELPADRSAGARLKLYIPPKRLAASDFGAHAAILRLAAELGLDRGPYEDLIHALHVPDPEADRPPILMAGVSVSAAGPSLEAYVFLWPWDAKATGPQPPD